MDSPLLKRRSPDFAASYDVTTPLPPPGAPQTMSHLPPDRLAPHGPAGSYGPPPQGWTEPGWAAPPGWAPPPGEAPGWAPSHGWAPGWAAPTLGRRTVGFDPARWLGTVVVAVIMAGVVLGGIGLDAAIAAPSAGTVIVGGPVSMTAAPGWVLAPAPDDTSGGIELQKADAILTAQVLSSSYSGDSASMLSDQQASLSDEAAQISYSDVHTTSVSGHDTAFVVFEATVMSDQGSGVVDGELICMVVEGNAVVIVVAAPQGDLDPVIDDISAMLVSVEVGR